MGTGLSLKYKNTYGSISIESGSSFVSESTATYNAKKYVTLRQSTGHSNINDNVKNMNDFFPVNEFGQFGERGKHCRVIYSDDPVRESKTFYDMIGNGGQIRQEVGKNVTITRLDDNTEISYRVITSTEGSLAVFINVMKVVNSVIHTQKIHFIGK